MFLGRVFNMSVWKVNKPIGEYGGKSKQTWNVYNSNDNNN